MTPPTPSTVTDEKRKPLKCPHCGEELNIEMRSKLMDKSRMSINIVPNEGELLSARTIGDTLSQMQKMMAAFGKELGVKENVLVEGVTFDTGGVRFDLLVTRHDINVGKRATPPAQGE